MKMVAVQRRHLTLRILISLRMLSCRRPKVEPMLTLVKVNLLRKLIK